MYQWTEPDSGSTQFSGKPPPWYRSDTGGPRVFVFDNGRLIDDTAVQVSDGVRQRLRQEALVLVEEDYQKAREKMVKAQGLKQKFEKEESKKPEQTSQDSLDEESLIADSELDELMPDDVDDKDKSITDKSLDELREMIADWEKSQSEDAKESIRKALEP